MKKLKNLEKTLIRQQWQVGDLAIRLGHPYTYPDNDAKPLILDCDTFQGINHYLGAYYIVKDTPKYIIEKNSKKNFKKLKELFKKVHRDLLPYKKLNQIYVDGQASNKITRYIIHSKIFIFEKKYNTFRFRTRTWGYVSDYKIIHKIYCIRVYAFNLFCSKRVLKIFIL